MHCPGLADLPPPPPGRQGWPWTEESRSIPERQPDGGLWPRVSITTPSYNQGPFLEETIRSVLLQGYPDLEYTVVDGGSGDESVEIIRKYERWLAYWVSEPDKGQSDAINRGFDRASGEILAWINSDDVYEPGSILRVVTHLADAPECALVYGNGWYIDAYGTKTHGCKWIRPFDRELLLTFNFILQPAAFWRRLLWEETGRLEVAYHWAMDWDWFIRATTQRRPDYLPLDLARYRLRRGIKTLSGGEVRSAEVAAISRRYGGIYQPTHLMYQFSRVGSSLARRVKPGPLRSAVQTAFTLAGWFLRGVVWRGRCLL
jgi:glycosyltransferase involved in cell wall biosynthesis